MTKNLTPGTAVYGEKRISVEGPATEDGTVTKNEYRVWNPFRSKVNTPPYPGLKMHGILGDFIEFFSEFFNIAPIAMAALLFSPSFLTSSPFSSWLLVCWVVLMIST